MRIAAHHFDHRSIGLLERLFSLPQGRAKFDFGDTLLDSINDHCAGDFARFVAAHAVRDKPKRPVWAVQKGVFVELALEANIGATGRMKAHELSPPTLLSCASSFSSFSPPLQR
jgi:hypothetical protein